MKRLLVLCSLIVLCSGAFVGCDQKTKVKSQETVTTPGGSTTTTETTTVEKSGDHKDEPAK